MIADAGWLIHKKAQGDTSLSLAVFTAEHGLIRPYYKGGRSLKRKTPLQCFTPLWLEWNQKNTHCFIRKVEPQHTSLDLKGTALICAMYLNELIFLALKQPEPSLELYKAYEYSLVRLSQSDSPQTMAVCLRKFEWFLLKHCGVSCSLSLDTNGNPISPEQHYQFTPQMGLIISDAGIPGSALLAMNNKQWHEDKALQYAKIITRMAINDLLNYKPIQSRKLLYPSSS